MKSDDRIGDALREKVVSHVTDPVGAKLCSSITINLWDCTGLFKADFDTVNVVRRRRRDNR